jgi:hypothetical protein
MKYFALISFVLLYLNTECESSKHTNLSDTEFKEFVQLFSISDLPLLSNTNIENRKLIEGSFFAKYIIQVDSSFSLNDSTEYQTVCRIKCDYDFVPLIVQRSVYAKELENELSERFLCIYSSEGKLISYLCIQGIYGDDRTFFSEINEEFVIKSEHEILDYDVLEKKTTIYKRLAAYAVDKHGSIVKTSDTGKVKQ